jgi:phage shock protein PspC (stress-responsive transcriptional regulator)
MATRGELRRSRDERVLAGVCGGVARQLGVDANLVRLLTVVVSLMFGTGVLIYIAAWLLVPEDGEQRSILQQTLNNKSGRP